MLPYLEAVKISSKLGLKNSVEYRSVCSAKQQPDGLPTQPHLTYKNKGWVSYKEWLGETFVQYRPEYMPYEQAHQYVLKLGLKSGREWNGFIKSENLPKDIPKIPDRTYRNSGWISWSVWLGTGIKNQKKRDFLPYSDAIKLVHKLEIQTPKDWKKYSKSGKRPFNIPAAPYAVYKDKGWTSWQEWLGNDSFTRVDYSSVVSYEQAKDIAKNNHIKSTIEWKRLVKSQGIPKNIPLYPQIAYKDKGWISSREFLGIGRKTKVNETIALTYEEAEKISISLGFHTSKEWNKWAASDDARASKIPANPSIFYKDKGWMSWKKWLGRTKLTNFEKAVYFVSYEESKEYMHKLGIKSFNEWKEYRKTHKKPTNIPSAPDKIYKDKGWISWRQWLGYGGLTAMERSKLFPPFDEFKKLLSEKNIKSSAQWAEYYKNLPEPKLVPIIPKKAYVEWTNWYDATGREPIIKWDKGRMLDFLTNIQFQLEHLDAIELITIIQQSGAMPQLSKNKKFTKLLEAAPNTKIRTSVAEEIIEGYSMIDSNPEVDNVNVLETSIGDGNEREVIAENIVLGVTANIGFQEKIEELRAFDNNCISSSLDEESINFLINYRVEKIWADVISKKFDVSSFRLENGGDNFEIIKERFLNEYNSTISMPLPAEYSFKEHNGIPTEPNMMQRLVAHRLAEKKYYGNWSGPGAGKTLAAILAGRSCNLKNTLVITFNSTIDDWKQVISSSFRHSNIILSVDNLKFNVENFNYVILNYESFQTEYSEKLSEKLLSIGFDYIILDEIHKIKQREEETSSLRRYVISSMIAKMRGKNPDIKLMGMSATPVINNLTEPKKILELLNGVRYDEMKTFQNINNAMAMHRQMVLSGIRIKPVYESKIKTTTLKINGLHLLGSISKNYDENILSIERKLLNDKLRSISSFIKKGTVIYTFYVDGILDRIKELVSSAGLSYGMFTGDEKIGLEKFKSGELDVLIGSSPLGTGMDGIQNVCDRMIVITLPWTSSEYENLIGRIYRQGSPFGEVEIIIPQVVIELEENHTWSWDKERLKRINYKKTLSDAVLDGIIPDGLLPTQKELLLQSKEGIKKWIENVSEDKAVVIERERILIPYQETIIEIKQDVPFELEKKQESVTTADAPVKPKYEAPKFNKGVAKRIEDMILVRIDKNTVIYVNNASEVEAAKKKYEDKIRNEGYFKEY